MQFYANIVMIGLVSASAAEHTGGMRSYEANWLRTSVEGSQALPPLDAQAVLAAARGVGAPLCALAANGLSNFWGGSRWNAPAGAARADVGDLERRLRLGKLTADEKSALLNGLAAGDACVRQIAATMIGRAEDKSFVPDLARRVTSGGGTERESALIALGLMGSRATEAVDAMIRALRDTSSDIRAAAAWALGRSDDPRALHPVIGMIGDRNAEVRASSIVAVGRFRSEEPLDALLKVLREDSDAEVRRVAAWALGQLHTRRAAEGLSAALRGDKSADVREMSAWALAESNARDDVDGLTSALQHDESSAVRETSAWALAELNARQATDALAAAVAGDKDDQVRGTAAWALGQLHPGRAPASLVKAMRDADDDVRLKAAWAVSHIGDVDALPAVSEALKTETSQRVQEALVRALVETGSGSEEALSSLLQSKDARTREVAVRALAGHRGPWPWPWPWPRPRPMP